MQVTIEPIYHPIQNERLSNTSKWVVINNGDASQIIKILVATTYRTISLNEHGFMDTHVAVRTPDRNIPAG